MSEQPNYDSFQELLENNSHTENFDAVVPPDPAPRQNNNPPQIPQWGQSLTGRVANLEKNMTWVKQNMQNMATKQDFEKSTAAINAVNQRLDAQQKSLNAIVEHIKGK